MARSNLILVSLLVLVMVMAQSQALMPYAPRSFLDMMFPSEDPFRILEHTPLNLPKDAESLALARADWKESATEHVITMDIPGIKREDIKIEVEDNRVLRVSGERKTEVEVEGDKWHRSERTTGKFWRQFRLPANADMEHIKAHLENGVLKITVPKVAEEKKKQPKVIPIAEERNAGGAEIKATKDEM